MKKHIWRKILGIICIALAIVIWVACAKADPFMGYKGIALQLFFNCGWGNAIATVLAIAGFILTFGIEWLINLIDLINEGKPNKR